MGNIRIVFLLSCFFLVTTFVSPGNLDTTKSKNIFLLNTNIVSTYGQTTFKELRANASKNFSTKDFRNGYSYSSSINLLYRIKNKFTVGLGFLLDNFHYKILNNEYSYYVGNSGPKVTYYYDIIHIDNNFGISLLVDYIYHLKKNFFTYISAKGNYYFMNRISRKYLGDANIPFDGDVEKYNSIVTYYGVNFSVGIGYSFSNKNELYLAPTYTRFTTKNEYLSNYDYDIYFSYVGINLGMNFKLGKNKK